MKIRLVSLLMITWVAVSITAIALPVSAQDSQTIISITKDGPAKSGFLGLAFYTGSGPCNVAIICEDPNTFNFTCATRRIECQDSTAEALAAALTASINANCAAVGVTATVAGANITVKSTDPNVECCVFGDEFGFSGVFALGFNLGLQPGPVFCTVQNVCDGVAGNEAGPAVAGYSFTKVEGTVATESKTWGAVKSRYEK